MNVLQRSAGARITTRLQSSVILVHIGSYFYYIRFNSIMAQLSFSTFTKGFLCWVPFLLILPFVLVCLIVLSVYKGVVLILWKLLPAKHYLVGPLTGLDICFSTDDFFHQPLGGLSFIWVVDGLLCHELVIDRFEKVLAGRDRHDYAKLTSVYPTFWLGYPFWKKTEKEFNIRNHVKVMDEKDWEMREENLENMNSASGKLLNEMICKWMLEPFTKGLPLWEVRVVRNIPPFSPELTDLSEHGPDSDAPRDGTGMEMKDDKEQSILILKIHHTIGDGYSMLSLLDKIIDSPPREASYLDDIIAKKGRKSYEAQDEKKLHQIRGHKYKQQQRRSSSGTGSQQDTPNFTLLSKVDSNKCSADSQSGEVAGVGAMVSQRRWKATLCKWFCSQLSNRILLTFLTPSTLFALLSDFVFHRDSWFTMKKASSKLHLTTRRISMESLNAVRHHLRTSSSREQRCDDESSPENTIPVGLFHASHQLQPRTSLCQGENVPIIVIATSSLAGALRRLFTLKRDLLPLTSRSVLHADNVDDSGPAARKQEADRENTTSPGTSPALIPKTSNFVIALPLGKNHPGNRKFCNFWTHGILKAQMREENGLTRVSFLNKLYHEMQRGKSPQIHYSLVKFHSLLPELLLRIISGYNMGASIGITNMAGPSNCVFIGGRRVLSQYAYAGVQWRHASMTLALISYNGEVTATVVANKSVIPDRELVEMLSLFFVEELRSCWTPK